MQYKNRLIEDKIADLFLEYPVVAVLGAKQAGKSTLVENLFPEAGTFVFDSVFEGEGGQRHPEFFLNNYKIPAFFDDVHQAPELLSSIMEQAECENKKSLYLLSGFQGQETLERIKAMLPDRVGVAQLWSMSHREISGDTGPGFLESWLGGHEFDPQTWADKKRESTNSRIWHGGYPKILELPDALLPSYWQSYLHTYVERDVCGFFHINFLEKFNSFMEKLSALSGQEPNFNQLGRELDVNRKTILRWYDILVATYQWIKVPAFNRNPAKQIISKVKGYASDTGFACYLQRIATPEMIETHPMAEKLFETHVVLEIIKNLQKLPMDWNIYHFRSYTGASVDLVLEVNGGLYPIAIQANDKPFRKDVRSFSSFRECFPNEKIHQGLIVSNMEKPKRLSDSIVAIPWWLI